MRLITYLNYISKHVGIVLACMFMKNCLLLILVPMQPSILLAGGLGAEENINFNFPASVTNELPRQFIVKSNTPNLIIQTFAKTFGGMPGQVTPQALVSLEFAIAPVKGGAPMLDQAIIVSSNPGGKFKATLLPGKYWLGPREKIKNTETYQSGNFLVQVQLIEISDESITNVDLTRVSYAP